MARKVIQKIGTLDLVSSIEEIKRYSKDGKIKDNKPIEAFIRELKKQSFYTDFQNLVSNTFKATVDIEYKPITKLGLSKVTYQIKIVVKRNGVPDFAFHLINAGRDGKLTLKKSIRGKDNKIREITFERGHIVKNGYKQAFSKKTGPKYNPRIQGAATMPNTFEVKSINKSLVGKIFYLKKGAPMAGWLPRNYYKLFAEKLQEYYNNSDDDVLFGNTKNFTLYTKSDFKIVSIVNKHDE